MGGTSPWAPQTWRQDLLPFLLSLEVQAVRFSRRDNTTGKPNKNFLNTYCALRLEWQGEPLQGV